MLYVCLFPDQHLFYYCSRKAICCWRWTRRVWTGWPTPRPWPPSRPPSAWAAWAWSSWRWGREGETRSELAFNHSLCQGPETSFGASNFIPSWMFWQKLPRQLQYPKTVILHRRDGTSWGFSIVGAFLHQTTNTYYSPSCWGSVQKKCSMHFPICPQKNLRNADIYFIFQKESRYIALRNSFFLSITKGSW